MTTLKKHWRLIDRNVKTILFNRVVGKERFLKIYPDQKKLYDTISNSKLGIIKIEKVGDPNNKHWGFTAGFGEGIRCYMSNEYEWFTTSIIQKIDWDKKEFQTMNSVYKFEFDEIPFEVAYNDLKEMNKDFVKEYESKYKEA